MGLEAPFDDEDYEVDSDGEDAILHVQPVFADDEGEEEEEACGSFANLSCFRPRATKKKPVLIVDPEELEKEHLSFMQGAVASMEENEPHRPAPASLLGLSSFDEDEYEDDQVLGETSDEYGEAGAESPPRADSDRLLRADQAAEASREKPKKKMALHHGVGGDAVESDWFAVASEGAVEEPAGEDRRTEDGPSHQSATPREPDRPLGPLARLPLIEGDLPGDPFLESSALDKIAERLFGPGGSRAAPPTLDQEPLAPVNADEDDAEENADSAPGESAFAPQPAPGAQPPAPLLSTPNDPSVPAPDSVPEYDIADLPLDLAVYQSSPEEPEPEEPSDLPSLAEPPAAEASPEPAPEPVSQREHVVREWDFEEEAGQRRPEPDYEAARAETSRLRARLVREVEEQESEADSLLARVWRWLTRRS